MNWIRNSEKKLAFGGYGEVSDEDGNVTYGGVALRQPPDPFPVGAKEIAALLCVRENTVHHWSSRGLLPHPRWRVSDMPAWDRYEILLWAEATGRRPCDERERHVESARPSRAQTILSPA